MLYWITGLSRSGKTSIGRALHSRLLSMGNKTLFLDGDELRQIFGRQTDYSKAARLELGMQYARVCKLVTDQGIDVICATISLFHQCQAWNRKHIPRYTEVFLSVPRDILHARDNTRLYHRALKGEIQHVVGIDIMPEYPTNPELTVVNDGTRAPAEIAGDILRFNGQHP